MAKTHTNRILEYLWSIRPQHATNTDIREATGIQPHQQVYMLTQSLARQGKITSLRMGKTWEFFVGDAMGFQPPENKPPKARRGATRSRAAQFEEFARQELGQKFGVPLRARQVPGVPKIFDLVSDDGDIIGDAKYYTLVRGQDLPPAKFSIIAEHVWLLEKTQARQKFLVFGNDIEVPRRWLAKYGHLRGGVAFYYLRDEERFLELDEKLPNFSP